MYEKLKKHLHIAFFILLTISALICMAIIPPMQSPDEGLHLFRAYSLQSGQIILDTVDGKTGLEIDTGLFQYIKNYNLFRLKYKNKNSIGQWKETKEIHFSSENQFIDSHESAIYFPLNYLPQALAFTVGRTFKMPVYISYYLARFLSFLTLLLILMTAFKYQKPTPFVLSLLFMPMCLFQFASATADTVSFALTVLIMSIFSYLYQQDTLKTKHLYIMGIFTFLLCTHRMNMFALIFLPLILWYKFRKKSCLATTVIVGTFIVLWILSAMITVNMRHPTMIEIAIYYLMHPLETSTIFYNTLSDLNMISFYINSFVGILGYLDIYFPDVIIFILIEGLLIIFVFCIDKSSQKLITYSFSLIALMCFITTFLLLLVQFTNFPGATKIMGVQGRYFIPIAIVLGYTSRSDGIEKNKYILGSFLFLLFAVFSSVETIHLLLIRYYGL